MMKPFQWVTATAVAAVIGLFYIHQFIYTRTEAAELITRLNKLEDVHRDDMSKIYQELKELNQWLRDNPKR